MTQNGKILLADDELTFRQSTAELLRRDGYDCDCVADADAALERLKLNPYDLLIADIKMPGNPELELVKKVSEIAEGIQVIIVTAFPATKSAVEAVHLPVVAYMVKPIDFEQLKRNITMAVRQKKLFHTILQTKDRLQQWKQQMDDIDDLLRNGNKQMFSTSVRNFLDLTLTNIRASFTDLKNISQVLTNEKNESAVCNLLNCPRLDKLTEGLAETIKTLELTKSSFKSKELGDLRIGLEQLMKRAKNI